MLMLASIKAGVVYFVVVFAIGFGLGTIRVLAITPRLGQTVGVLLESPLILTASWVACRKCISFFGVEYKLRSRLLMGATAFLLLILAELDVSIFVFGQPAAAFFNSHLSIPGEIGLIAQAAFAAFPVLQNSPLRTGGRLKNLASAKQTARLIALRQSLTSLND
jgi:hypothetical protein